MVARNAFILEEMKEKAKNEGVEEKSAIGVKNMLKKGMASEEIAEILKVSIEFVEKIKDEISNE